MTEEHEESNLDVSSDSESGIEVDELEEVKSQLLRALADYQNLQRRMVDDISSARTNSIKPFLSVLDDLQRVKNSVADEELESPWVQGLILGVQKFEHTLDSLGIRTFGEVGDIFDPKAHEAISLVPGPDGKILELIAVGYTSQGKLIRPAIVVVGEGEIEDQDDASENNSDRITNESPNWNEV
ncbi:MAG: nucleotide exchange factor GrpE [Chloroflexota bacterium]|jgi:molecular chaperone GrpE|nr:nucleotide exchange factor GrpE [Chloroflexota bacterium]MEC7788988.1 nucleotide exchange factor GrpE [Chloroflexota bacterium]